VMRATATALVAAPIVPMMAETACHASGTI
jgi:hypothetical protein